MQSFIRAYVFKTMRSKLEVPPIHRCWWKMTFLIDWSMENRKIDHKLLGCHQLLRLEINKICPIHKLAKVAIFVSVVWRIIIQNLEWPLQGPRSWKLRVRKCFWWLFFNVQFWFLYQHTEFWIFPYKNAELPTKIWHLSNLSEHLNTFTTVEWCRKSVNAFKSWIFLKLNLSSKIAIFF